MTITLDKPSANSVSTGKSVTGAEWVFHEVSERDVLTFSQRYGLPEVVGRVLSARGVTLENAEDFLNPTLKSMLPDPFSFLDMEKAAIRLADAVKKGENIVIFGDYDVDGATSSSLLKRFFRSLGADVKIYIPDRIKEGYGPNVDALKWLKGQGADVCITVDCGTASIEPLAEAKRIGLDMVVIDHHLGGQDLPDAVAVVNPNRLDETSEYTYLAAVGMSFMLAVAVNAKLRECGWYDDHSKPDLMDLLDIVALGTVCDVVPLKGVNRAFVAQGLKVMRGRKNTGIAALSDIAAINNIPEVYHLGFVLGPRINAGGRVGKSDLGARLLSTEDADEAHEISKQLDLFNAERKAIEQLVLEQAIEQVEKGDVLAPLLFAKSEGWHPGVIGIVAGRLKEKYNRPVAVISLENGVGKASARSVSGIDFGAAVVSANQSGLLVAGGGHAMAAGFTVEEAKIDQLHKFIADRFAENIEDCFRRVIRLDGYLQASGVTVELAKSLKIVGPFGVANHEPRFAIGDAFIVKADIVGLDHVRCILSDGKGKSIKAMAFRSVDTPLGQTILSSIGKKINIAGKVKLNSWQGVESAELLIDDIAV